MSLCVCVCACACTKQTLFVCAAGTWWPPAAAAAAAAGMNSAPSCSVVSQALINGLINVDFFKMNDFSTVRELLVLQPATYVPIKQPLPNSLGDKSRTAVHHPLHPQSGLEWHSGRPTLECSCQYTVTLPPTTHHTHSHACRVPDSP